MFKKLILHRQLIWNFVVRDLKGRYAGSVMGVFWNIINPLITLGVYTFVFSYIMKTKLPSETGTSNFAVFLFCGMMPWIAFSEAVSRSTTAITDNAGLVKKVQFPFEILIVYIIISSFIHELLALLLFLALLMITGTPPGSKAIYLPFLFLVQLMFTLGLSLFLSSANVYIRDIAPVMGAVMMVWFFGTPIVYPLEAVPESFRTLAGFNPIAQLVEAYRDLLLRNQFHSLKGLGYLTGISLMALLGGMIIFNRTRKEFADLI